MNVFSLFARKALLCWGGAATTEYWGGLDATVCAGSLREKDHYFSTTSLRSVTSDAALYIPASPTPSPPHPHLLARCGEGTCLHIYSTQAGDRNTMLHNHTVWLVNFYSRLNLRYNHIQSTITIIFIYPPSQMYCLPTCIPRQAKPWASLSLGV